VLYVTLIFTTSLATPISSFGECVETRRKYPQ